MSDIDKAEFEAEVKKAIKEQATTGPTGAACFYSALFHSCGAGITHQAAKDIAQRRGLQVIWHEGKQCGDINCPP